MDFLCCLSLIFVCVTGVFRTLSNIWSLFAKLVNNFLSLTIFKNELHHRCLTGSETRLRVIFFRKSGWVLTWIGCINVSALRYCFLLKPLKILILKRAKISFRLIRLTFFKEKINKPEYARRRSTEKTRSKISEIS